MTIQKNHDFYQPFPEGCMAGFMSPTGLGHNDRYFILIDEAAIRICWGDLCLEYVGYPMIFKTHALVLMLVTLITMALIRSTNNDTVIVTDLAKQEEPEKIEKLPERTIIPQPVPTSPQYSRGGPRSVSLCANVFVAPPRQRGHVASSSRLPPPPRGLWRDRLTFARMNTPRQALHRA